MSTSLRDLLITGWLIILAVTVSVVIFHSDYQQEGGMADLRLAGLAAIGTVAGMLMVRYVDLIGNSSQRFRRIALVLFAACMVALIPVMVATFALPWGVLIILTLVYSQ